MARAARNALKALLAAKDPKLPATLQSLLTNEKLRDAALAGLALYDDAGTPAKGFGCLSAVALANEEASGTRDAFIARALRHRDAESSRRPANSGERSARRTSCGNCTT